MFLFLLLSEDLVQVESPAESQSCEIMDCPASPNLTVRVVPLVIPTPMQIASVTDVIAVYPIAIWLSTAAATSESFPIEVFLSPVLQHYATHHPLHLT